MLKREITTMELLALNKMFSDGRGYKDLIRDFKKDFDVVLPKQTAKQFMTNRSWKEVFKWLTGQDIEPADDNIPRIERDKYETLEKMVIAAKDDEAVRSQQLDEFEAHKYYIPAETKFINIPMYGEIITYKYKDPYIKCFLLNEKRKIEKIEDVPVSNDLPDFLLRILRKINMSKIVGDVERDPFNAIKPDDIESLGLVNIFDSELFKEYNIVARN